MLINVTLLALTMQLAYENPFVPVAVKHPYTLIPSYYTPVMGGLDSDYLFRTLNADVNERELLRQKVQREKDKHAAREIIVEIVARERVYIEKTTKKLKDERDQLSAFDLLALSELLRISQNNLRHYEQFIPDHPGIEKEIEAEIRKISR